MALKKLRGLKKWISKDKEKLTWIWNELRRTGGIQTAFIQSDADALHIELLAILDELATTENGQKLITDARAKWSREQYKNNPNNKGLTITIKPSMIARLDYLSAKNSRRKTLESLIEMGHETEKEMRKIRREEINKLKEELQEKWPKKQFISPLKQLQLKHDHKLLKQAFEHQQKILDSVLLKNAQYKNHIKNSSGEDSTLDIDEAEVLELHEKLKTYYSKILDAEEILNADDEP